jgi:CheY-specific phosphatase CheX
MADIQKYGQSVANALSKTLEALAFMELFPLYDDNFQPVDSEDVIDYTYVVWAKIPFVRPVKGSMTIILSPDLANNLTEVIYGFFDEGSVTEELMMDALAEISNVLAGRFLTEILPKGVAFELGLPSKGQEETVDTVPEDKEDFFPMDYALEGHRFTVILAGNNLEIS